MSRKSHKNLVLSLTTSVILHSFLFFLAYILKSDGEEQVYKVLFRPYRPAPAKPLYPAERPSIPRAVMEMLPKEGKPQLPPEGFAAIDDTSRWVDELRKSALRATFPESLEETAGSKTGVIKSEEEEILSASDITTPYDLPSQEEFELFSIDDLRYEKYDATIIRDPDNKRNITGYFKMAVVHFRNQEGGLSFTSGGVDNLLRYVRDYTNISTQIKGVSTRLRSGAIFSAPLIYMGGSSVQLNQSEIENLGIYLRASGFLFVDDMTGKGFNQGPFIRQMKMYLKEALRDSLGREPEFRRISNAHPLFHAFYDFDDGPPIPSPNYTNDYLEGVWIDDRLAVLLSAAGISGGWGAGGGRYLQFGANLIVYTLTHAPPSLVKTRPMPAWVKRPPRVADLEGEEKNKVSATEAYLALLRVPSYKSIEPDRLSVYLNGVKLDVSEIPDTSNGIMFKGLKPGDYVLKVQYRCIRMRRGREVHHATKSERVDLLLIDGKVVTVKFGINEIFFRDPWLVCNDPYLEYPHWVQQHADLKIAGIHEDYQQPSDARPVKTTDPMYTDR